MPRLPLALALLAVFMAAPLAQAFPASDAEVDVAYAAGAMPVVLASGEVGVAGEVRDGLFVLGLNETRLGPLVQLTVSRPDDALGVRNETFRDVHLVLHRGLLVWTLPEGGAVRLDASLEYGLGVALPQAPFGAEEGQAAPPGMMLMGPGLESGLSWGGASAELFPLDATVSVQDRTGKPYAGWDHRRVNTGATPSDHEGAQDAARFAVDGAFAGTLRADAFAAGLGEDATMRLSVRASPVDRLPETLDLFARMGEQLSQGGGDGGRGNGGGDGGPFGGGANPLDALEGFSGLLNGALLVIAAPSEEGGEAPVPRMATINGEPVDVGPFALMRSRDLALAWSGDEMRIQGTSSVAITKDGFAVARPAAIGIVPVASLVLWALAAGAIVFFVVKRPPKGDTKLLWRGVSAGVNLVVLLVVFWLWDRAFAETFGTSFLTRAAEVGFSAESLPQLGTLFGLQMIPWSVAALFFALPVRIALGVGLRYLGKGKSFKGVATAGGLVALGVLGPFYALWLLDALIGQVVANAPMFPGG